MSFMIFNRLYGKYSASREERLYLLILKRKLLMHIIHKSTLEKFLKSISALKVRSLAAALL
jgi:hypothetical protein